MLLRARELCSKIDAFQSKYSPMPAEDAASPYSQMGGELTNRDWKEIDLYLALPRPFVKFTKRMEGNADSEELGGAHGAIWEVFVSMQILGEGIDAALTQIPEEGDRFVSNNFKKRVKFEQKMLNKY